MLVNDWKKDILTIPNVLSIIRLVMIPIYVMIYLQADELADYYLAAGILVVSCLTDMIDGKIARHFNMISNIGKILDPLADKATQITLIICLSVKYSILWYLVGLFVLKEGFQIIAGGIHLRKGKILKGALFSGKICTTILFISLIIMVMLPGLSTTIVHAIAVIDFLFMSFAFLDYIRAYFKNSNKLQELDAPNNNK